MAAASSNLMQTIGLNNSNFYDSRISVNISIKTGAVPAQSNQPLESQKLGIPNLSSGGSELKLTKG
jgi:hypothetical protein